MSKLSELQNHFENLLKLPPGWKRKDSKWSNVPFSPFIPERLESAVRLAEEFMQHETIHDVLNKANLHKTNDAHDPEVLRYALLLFGAHHPPARNALSFPRMIQRTPKLALPNPNNTDSLAWFLEDPNMNEHHEHWHIVYPSSDSQFNKDRHGELFLYMHRQMLSRYDAERFCAGQPPVSALNLDQPITSPYTPSVHLEEAGDAPFADRPTGLRIRDVPQQGSVSDLKTWASNIKQAISDGNFATDSGNIAVTADNLGDTLEASTSPNGNLYGNLHNMGHVLISFINTREAGRAGVMIDTRTACRDPVFWQWHRFVDSFYSLWQNTQPVKDWSQDQPPPIKVLKIALAFNDVIGQNDPSQYDINNQNNVTTELQTTFLSRTFTWTEGDEFSQNITYLFPRGFTYFFNVQNTSNQPISTTFRVFLAPNASVDSLISWIELDKFRQDIPASATTLVSRNSDLSSVIRKPAQKNYNELDATALPTRDGVGPQDAWCDCGWPFHLLLPKGSEQGAKFKLFVFISDWSKDQVLVNSSCGSLSFCGALDKYPDARPMGYPFDSPLKNGKFSDTFAGVSNLGELDISIKTYPYSSAQWAKPYAQQPQPPQ